MVLLKKNAVEKIQMELDLVFGGNIMHLMYLISLALGAMFWQLSALERSMHLWYQDWLPIVCIYGTRIDFQLYIISCTLCR